METKTLTHEVYFAVTPEEIFEGMVDPTKHSEFTGAPAKIEPKQGGKFTLYNGQLTGTFVEIQTNQRLVQEWRAANWPAGHSSQLTLTFSPLAEGRQTQLSMVHSGVPAERFEEINHGWRDYYWNKMAAYFREKKVAVVRRFMDEFKNKAN
ncbi:MAG TPA: SRPBCC family protein, partial [Terriglobia bacterium]|nr:SRPBCC family protein [Terriglobia bacterium]